MRESSKIPHCSIVVWAGADKRAARKIKPEHNSEPEFEIWDFRAEIRCQRLFECKIIGGKIVKEAQQFFVTGEKVTRAFWLTSKGPPNVIVF